MGGVQAAVLNSCTYGYLPTAHVSQVKAPILILRGTADSPADGGTSLSNVQMARAFEAAMRKAGKPVESVY